MAQIAVTFEALANAEQQINQCASQLTQQLDELRQMLQPLVSSWTGQAMENYQVQQQAWTQAQQDALQVLQGIGRVVGAAHDAYQSTEKSNAAAWN
ncbi:WXG100 family type VII secretion target [Actinospica robiniae]|uniref:WXG100 family type VII secretion target n=1 Tax=Actinospica robiniae TaxID=304901 RepID=UPI0003FFD14A|nr:WXG100 family type VII secretion target [Actinospica robiniae]